MKEVEKPYIKRYQALRLYKNDLEEIVSIFERNSQENKIVVDKYELTSISDIDKIKRKTVTKFSINHHHYTQEKLYRSVSLDLDRDHAMLYVSNDADTNLLGIASQIDTFLLKKKNVAGFLTSPIVAVLGTAIPAILFFVFSSISWKYSDHSLNSVLLMTLTFTWPIVAIVWTVWTAYVRSRKYTLIYLMDSTSKTSFFSRNKDQIILALTVGILTAVITGVLTTVIITHFFQAKP